MAGWLSRKSVQTGFWAVGGVLAFGAVLALLDGKGLWYEAFISYAVLLALVGLLLAAVARGVHAGRGALAAAAAAFIIRLAVGVTLTLLLPSLGYQNNEASLSGYVYKDAYARDSQAWQLAASDRPISAAFGGSYSGDQYGGLLALSALAYRYLGLGAHRPFLVLILAAAAGALGALWMWKGVLQWGAGDEEIETKKLSRFALCAAWIFALYPENVLLGSSQMREPFVTAGIALAFYGFTLIYHHRRLWLAVVGLAAVALFLFQSPAALAAMAVLIGLLLLQPGRRFSWKALAWIGVLALVGGVIVFITWKALPGMKGSGQDVFTAWLQKNFHLQTYMLERVSGWSQRLISQLGANGGARILFVSAYGAAQPVLPAALVVPAGAPIWQVIGIFRALGWYLMIPLLLYGLVSALFSQGPLRWSRLWLNLVVWSWILIAAVNAGADQWDNPRYRTIFIAWMAILAAWTWVWKGKDPWFWRLAAVEGIFLLATIEWYISRYYTGMRVLDIWVIIAITVIAGAGFLLGSWAWDRWKLKK